MLNESDKFIVLASDGLWEFLSNTEVMNIVTPFWRANNPDAACEKLVFTATTLWKKVNDNYN
jgi:serine/threonine protein phosphatase PrpC